METQVAIVGAGPAGLVLARLLAPHDWGLAAMVLVCSGFVIVFTDSALGTALIQRRDLSDADRSTVFWTSVGIGVLLAVGGMLLAGPLARPEHHQQHHRAGHRGRDRGGEQQPPAPLGGHGATGAPGWTTSTVSSPVSASRPNGRFT